MNYTLGFARICFFLVCMICTVMYTLSNPAGGEAGFSDLFLGVGFGSLIGATLVGIDLLLRPYHLRELLTVIVGLLVGYALGRIVWLLVENSVPRGLDPAGTFLSTARLSITLTSCYLGLVFASRSSDEWYLSLPFVRLKPQTTKKRDVLLDPSTLCDPRIIDLAASGLVDQQLVLPRFVMNDLFSQAELGDDSIRMRARKAIETVRKLESLPDLELRFDETIMQSDDKQDRILKLARLINANILSADMSRVRSSAVEGVRIISLHSLSNALKPITQSGEHLEIKIQRHGKEPRQGVGYLEDGTMVVVNGGGDYIGDTISATVLSVKHTSSGRMIFCNTVEDLASLSSYSTRIDRKIQSPPFERV